jgi:hypothetical protein
VRRASRRRRDNDLFPSKEDNMATTDPQRSSAQPTRSENLLPPGQDDSDGRFDVAEEVNLDQQSDAARRVGQAPANPVPDVPGAPGLPPGAAR